jgi:SNF2 family DNA or RNA helicase
MNPYHFKTKPYHHQLVAFKRALKQHYLAVLWEPRLGKSKLIIDWACAEHQLGHVNRVLILCPLSVIGVWEDEFEIHSPQPYRLHVLGLDDVLIPFSEKKLNVCLVNYDRAWRRKKLLQSWHPDMVVADESHRLKRPGARRSLYMRSWKKAKYRAILTGTVVTKSYLDVFGQWAFLNNRQFGNRVDDFRARYLIMGGFMKKQIKGYRNFDELKSKIKMDSTIRHESQVFDMPPTIEQRVPVFLDDKTMIAYRKMEYELFLELRRGEVSDAKNIAVKLLRLQQITGGWIKSDEGNIHQISTDKLHSAWERLENLWNDDERVVVFCRFLPELRALSHFGVRSGISTYSLSGATRREDRDVRRRRFEAKVGPSLFVSQIQTGGLGISLAAAAEVIYYSYTYSYDDYYQSSRRIRGPKQTRTMRYQHLVVPNSIDTDIYANLKMKQGLLDSIMGDPKAYARKLEARLEKRI